jgi:hypothetical protein
VSYLTVEPIAKKDNTPIVENGEGNFFWLNGGKS